MIGAAALALVAGGAWWAKREGLILRDVFAAACEDAIKEGLRSPSTYREMKVAETTVPASDEEIAKSCFYRPEGAERDRCIEAVRLLKPQSHLRRVDYEASNAYGVPVAGTAACSVVSTRPRDQLNDDPTLAMAMTFNGRTALERDLAKVEALKEAIQSIQDGR